MYQRDDSLGPCASSHLTTIRFPPRYNKRWPIDGKFRGITALIGDLMSIAITRGGRRQISRGANSKL